MHSCRFRRVAFGCALLAATAFPASAAAKNVSADLRVESTNGKILADVTQYTSPAKVKTDRGADCFGSGNGGSGDRVKIPNPTALGLIADALPRLPRLRPLSLTDHFSFGLGVCGIGGLTAGDPDPFWYVKRNHVGAQVGGDQVKVHRGDQILWYLAPSFPAGAELRLKAPARAKPNDPVPVKVLTYTDTGKRKPAAGATVDFASGPTDAKGRTSLVFPSAGHTSVQATRGGDIPSAKVRVCVDADISRCPSHRGRIILGSPRSDDISTPAGNDHVRAGAGDDRISIRAGGADSVGCGPGKDVVVASRGDHDDAVGSSCEKVIRK
jgi:hypothetical protein